MTTKTILILIDGMRPDALQAAHTPAMDRIMQGGFFHLSAQTVMPSVTLPCHMSLFHSVTPARHGITSNTYTPMARPIRGLFDVLSQAGYSTASFYNWEPLRDLSVPGSLTASLLLTSERSPDLGSDQQLTALTQQCLRQHPMDFIFLYLGNTDTAGHQHGWMSVPYLQAIERADACIQTLLEELGDAVNIFVTADHGGHEQHHGSDSPQDMTIPIFGAGPAVPALGELTAPASILDIAPTILTLFGEKAPQEWAGKALF
jgi:predicted AlkP superfamily pyrophosphatase or phosphodiesterase